MLSSGRLVMNERETLALDQLRAEHGDQAAITRTEPGEQGPLRVEIGARAWLIDAAGTITAQ